MFRRVHLLLRVSSALLVFSGYLALTSVRDYPPALLLVPAIFVALAPLGEWLDEKSRSYRIVTKAVALLFFLSIPYAWWSLGIMNGVVSLTMFIQAYTLLHKKEERNYYHLYLMAFFLLLAASVQAPEPSIGLVMALFLLSGVWAFISLRIHEELRNLPGGKPAEIVPKLGVLSSQREANTVFDWGLIAAVSALSFAAIVLTAAIFVFTPGVEAGILGRNSFPMQTTGIPQTVSLAGSGKIRQDYTPVMSVRFPDEAEGQMAGANDFYWRVTTLPRYTFSRWERVALTGRKSPRESQMFPRMRRNGHDMNPYVVDRDAPDGARLVRQQIYMDDVPAQGVPVLDTVVSLEVDGHPKNVKVAWDANMDFTVNLTTRGPRRLSYEAKSQVDRPTPEQLRAAPSNYAEFMDSRDLETLTHQDLLPETIALAQRLTVGKNNAYDKAIAIRDWLGGKSFLYTVDVPPLPPDNSIDAFVNKIRRGHCELFGSALALMLRSQGIPCRAVSGYRGGEWNATDASYIIRGNMAHLWVEVYFPNHGWIVFDPSPRPDPLDMTLMGQVTRFASWAQLRSKMFWYQNVVGFDRSLALNALRSASLRLVAWFQREPDAQPEKPEFAAPPAYEIPWRGIALGIMLAGLVIALWRLRRAAAARIVLTIDQARAVHLFRELQRRLAALGIDIRGKTAEELRALASARGDIDPAALETLVTAYNEARFGKRPLARPQYTQLRAKLRTLRVRAD